MSRGSKSRRSYWDAAAKDSWSSIKEPITADRFGSINASLIGLGLQPKGAKRCLDFGCGAGSWTGVLSQLCEHVVAVDLSPAAVDLARERHKGLSNLKFLSMDLSTFEARERLLELSEHDGYDLVVSSNMLIAPSAALNEKLLDNLVAVLREGGAGAVLVPAVESVGLLRERIHAWKRRSGPRRVGPTYSLHVCDAASEAKNIYSIMGTETQHYTAGGIAQLLRDRGLSLHATQRRVEYDWEYIVDYHANDFNEHSKQGDFAFDWFTVARKER